MHKNHSKKWTHSVVFVFATSWGSFNYFILRCKLLINSKNQFHDFVSKHVVEQLPPDQSAEHGFESKQAKEALVGVKRSKNDQQEIKQSKCLLIQDLFASLISAKKMLSSKICQNQTKGPSLKTQQNTD